MWAKDCITSKTDFWVKGHRKTINMHDGEYCPLSAYLGLENVLQISKPTEETSPQELVLSSRVERKGKKWAEYTVVMCSDNKEIV